VHTRLYLSLTLALLSGWNVAGFPLHDPGAEDIIDYEKYGRFVTDEKGSVSYVLVDQAGLARASGEGIDPSLSIADDPAYQAAKSKKRWRPGDHWQHVGSSDPQLDFFVWNDAPEEPGVRLLFVGRALEKGGQLLHALKAYRAVMVLYPDSATWSAGGEFQWSAAEAAWHSMQNLLRKHPELNLRLVDADVTTRAEFAGLRIHVRPGRLESIQGKADAPSAAAREPLDRSRIQVARGTGEVHLVQYANGDWEMLVGNAPYFIRGMTYMPTKIGVVPWEWNWLWADENRNGLVDMFEVWAARNANNIQDPDEPTTSDFALMRDMGVNTIRLFITDPELVSFNLLAMRQMYHEFGIRVLVGNFLGAYCNGSGARWEQGTDYTNRKQRDNMKASVSNMVMKLKDEPWVLAWLLGNENNMEKNEEVNATRTNASEYPETYARFLNEVCRMVHELDPHHPVGVGNLLVGLVEHYGRLAPELDFIGINSYIGGEGFGATWQKISQTMNRPVVITEFGCDSYWSDRGPDEDAQTAYLLGNWEDIEFNRAGGSGVGNSIGGFVFEWLDEWWKDTHTGSAADVARHNSRAVFPMPFPDGFAQEEWFGLMGQGAGTASPFQRVPKKAYHVLRDVWNPELITRKEAPAANTDVNVKMDAQCSSHL